MHQMQRTEEDFINRANNNIAASASKFMNYIEDVKLIAGEEDKTSIEQNIAKIEQAYHEILEIYRPNIRRFVNQNVRTLAAMDKLLAAEK